MAIPKRSNILVKSSQDVIREEEGKLFIIVDEL